MQRVSVWKWQKKRLFGHQKSPLLKSKEDSGINCSPFFRRRISPIHHELFVDPWLAFENKKKKNGDLRWSSRAPQINSDNVHPVAIVSLSMCSSFSSSVSPWQNVKRKHRKIGNEKKNKTTTQRPVETMSSRRMATKERRKQKETRLNFITWGEYSPLRDSRSPMTAGGRGGGHGGPLTDWASRGDRDNHQIRKKNKKIKIKIKKSNQINRTAFVPFVHFLFFWFFFFFFFFCDHFSLGLWILLVLLGFTGFYWVLPSFT